MIGLQGPGPLQGRLCKWSALRRCSESEQIVPTSPGTSPVRLFSKRPPHLRVSGRRQVFFPNVIARDKRWKWRWGVSNQVKGRERMWDWFVCEDGGGQEVLQEPVGFTFASAPQCRRQSLSVASVSQAGKWVHLVSPTSWPVGIDKWCLNYLGGHDLHSDNAPGPVSQ